GVERPVEVGVVAHAVAVASYAHDVAVVEQAVDQGGGHDLVPEDLAPLREALVAREHRGRLFVAARHELKEEHGAGAAGGQVAALVDHEDRRVGQHLEPLLELAGGLRLFQAGDEIGQRAVVDAASALGRGDRQADGQVGLSDPGRAQEDHVLLAFDEAQLVQALDLLTTEAGLKREVEAFERLYGRQAAGAHGRLQAAGVPELDLGSEQALDRLAAGDRPAVDPREDGIERFQRAGHL